MHKDQQQQQTKTSLKPVGGNEQTLLPRRHTVGQQAYEKYNHHLLSEKLKSTNKLPSNSNETSIFLKY